MNRNQQVFSIASLVNGISFSMILPLLAPLIREFKLSELQGGAMVSAGALFMAIAAIYISKNQTKYSIYQLLVIGFIGMSVTWTLFSGLLMYGMTASISLMSLFVLLVLARASTGVFMAMPQIALQTYVMNHFHDEQSRSQTMSKFGALNSFGIIVGPFLTTIFLVGGLLTPLWIAVVLLALVSVFIFFRFDQKTSLTPKKNHSIEDKHALVREEHDSDASIQSTKLSQPTSFSIRDILFWLSLGFYLYLAIVTLNLTAGFYIQDHFQMSIQESAVYFSQCSLIVGISLVIMQMIIAKLLKWSVYQLLAVGIVIMALGLGLSIWTEQIRVFQAAYVLYGIAVACFIPAFTTGAAQKAPQPLQGKVAGWCTATQALSFVIGPLISTGLYQFEQALPYYFLILALIILAIYAVMTKLKDQRLDQEKVNQPYMQN